tara:strand:+ start:26 stop:655 length:630 start_codon:yes stop_codon:yes gene_type:complete
MKKKNITIINYGLGNIYSIKNALKKLDCNVSFSNNKNKILKSDGLILPGVGSFRKGMAEIKKRKLEETLNQFALSNKPLLGICLGMQLLLNTSTEFGFSKGLGLIDGKVEKLSNKNNIKLPNINWLNLKKKKYNNKNILNYINNRDYFYFVHSFVCKIKNEKDIISYSYYHNNKFVSVFKHKNIIGCQFHPEKSSLSGIKFYKNFIKLC